MVPAVAGAGPAGHVGAAAVPPKPYNTHLSTLKTTWHPDGTGTVKVKMTWSEKSGVASGFRVIGLLRCVRESQAHDGQACIIAHTALKASDIKRIKTFGGSVRSAILYLSLGEGIQSNELWGSSGYYGILLGAYNSHGQSVLTIVKSAKVCWGCTY